MSQFLFLSTLSLRRATLLIKPLYQILIISIHALLAESDDIMRGADSKDRISIHALLAESDGTGADRGWPVPRFLSTLSLRRATFRCSVKRAICNFYPRSPCGERRNAHPDIRQPCAISIHALLAESDTQDFSALHHIFISIHALLAESDVPMPPNLRTTALFLSTLSLRRATIHSCSRPSRQSNFYPRSPCGERRGIIWRHIIRCRISIHALLAESDPTTRQPPTTAPHFYPRSPCGERPAHFAQQIHSVGISIHALLAEGDKYTIRSFGPNIPFLSTLSLRRATSIGPLIFSVQPHFYPRSPCGERRKTEAPGAIVKHFYPRSPCGERL